MPFDDPNSGPEPKRPVAGWLMIAVLIFFIFVHAGDHPVPAPHPHTRRGLCGIRHFLHRRDIRLLVVGVDDWKMK